MNHATHAERRAATLDPDASALLHALADAGPPDLQQLSPEQARTLLGDLFTPDVDPEPIAAVEERKLRADARDVRVRIYDPDPDETLPAVVYFHGGGWVVGNLDTHDGVARSLAIEGECVVVSVDYRKAPEHPFPGAVEDAYLATRWTADNAAGIGAGAGLAVAGESAGGTLATVVTQMAAEKELGAPEIDHQVLFYPVTDHAFDTHSYAENADGFFLTGRAMVWFWNHYLRDDIDGANLRASPLRAPERLLAELPPVTLFSCGYDPLRDEQFAYAEALEDAGVPVEHTNYDGMIHDFANMRRLADPFPNVEAAADVRQRAGEALRGAFE
ncbi:alpha/beta hydrolase [Halalkalicoccus jeotgali]|uniref:Alpha/beta hydrolase fold-3 domain protein n=1 Tax=Halalkalicoccus jeotgali (strain DSM 18796 / CECT 7217 / JCM 14584 / KCTC 4019 / B3) TaxID=795797 RepID=D8J463_HALJB|nr:alpha/beta hydrolase [Halalkalicoccus jeotgali]ADJ15455.1 Alpha/beta hydrolase fold-3 domain protein [Halalkalicoccus jeotgali B3]ELY36136.1 alpha/beta hydrolase fold-3 domain-containing protein [Halalkalicoccus jeotgali B3]